MPEAPEKNLALDIVRITEAAALSSARWLGRGNKEAGDGAAVDAMRNSFSTLHVDGIVVIGEGEKDHAPMLYNGEKVGMGDGPQLDVAVDPVEGTSLLAYGRPNAISTVAVAPRGSMFNPGPSYYMQKLVVAREARDVIDLDAPVDVNLHNVARALGKNVQDLVVFVLDKPRHKKLIEDIRSTGARIQLHTDGDVAGALMAVDPRSEVDVMMGTGGTPEGVLAACAIKGMGGQILARLDPQSYVEKEAINEAGIDIREVLLCRHGYLRRRFPAWRALQRPSCGDPFPGAARQDRDPALCGILPQYGQALQDQRRAVLSEACCLMRKTGCRGWLAGGLLCGLLLCGLTVVVPVDVEAAAVTTVYDGQGPVEEKELLRFLDVLPQFRNWARENRIEAHPVARRGKADFLYPDDAARWVEAKGWDARRFFCVMGRMAAALVIVEEGNDLQVRPKDMPVVDKAEVELARKHLGSLLKVSMPDEGMSH